MKRWICWWFGHETLLLEPNPGQLFFNCPRCGLVEFLGWRTPRQ